MSKKILYSVVLLMSVLLFVLAFTVFANTDWIGGIFIGISVYLFLGVLIKLCKTNEKLRNTIICALDLLFWLP